MGTMRAHLIMAWLQQQSTRERPDTVRKLRSTAVKNPCNAEADHTFKQPKLHCLLGDNPRRAQRTKRL
jgi:hypothetical protein